MNNISASPAPAATARRAAEGARPVESILAALVLFLATLLGAATASHAVRRLAALLLGARRPSRAITPAQHRRALGDLRALHAEHTLPLRPHPFRATRSARRRIAICWRILINPQRRRFSYARPSSDRAAIPPHPRAPRRHRHARAGPAPFRPSAAIAFARPHNATL